MNNKIKEFRSARVTNLSNPSMDNSKGGRTGFSSTCNQATCYESGQCTENGSMCVSSNYTMVISFTCSSDPGCVISTYPLCPSTGTWC